MSMIHLKREASLPMDEDETDEPLSCPGTIFYRPVTWSREENQRIAVWLRVCPGSVTGPEELRVGMIHLKCGGGDLPKDESETHEALLSRKEEL